MAEIRLTNQATPAVNPPAGETKVYVRLSDGHLVRLDSAGTEVDIETTGLGDVVGPGSATDNAIARFDTATGKLIQNSVVIVSDTGVITGVSTINGVTVETHNARHVAGGADEIDGDVLDIDYSPTNYTEDTTPPEVTATNELTAHLAGIDNALASVGSSNIVLDEHFLGPATSQNDIGNSGWRSTGNGAGNAIFYSQENGHPGIITIEPGTSSASGRRAVHLGQSSALHITLSDDGSQNAITFEWIIQVRGTIGSADLESIQLGVAINSDMAVNGQIQTGVAVIFEPGTSNFFRAMTTSSGTASKQDGTTTVVIDTWYRVAIEFTDNGGSSYSAQLVVDGSNEGSAITTNAPLSTSLMPFAKIDGTGAGGTEPQLDIDRFRIYQTITP